MKAEISMPQTVRGLTLEIAVTGMKRTRLRLWLGCKIMLFAAFVMGCDIEVDVRR